MCANSCMRQSWLARTVRLAVLLLSVDLALAMRIVLQRVKSASVTVEDAVVSSINRGVLALVGLREGDTTADLEYCAKKLCAAKLFANEEGKGWRKAARQLDYEVLLVSRRVVKKWLLQRWGGVQLALRRLLSPPDLTMPQAAPASAQPPPIGRLGGSRRPHRPYLVSPVHASR